MDLEKIKRKIKENPIIQVLITIWSTLATSLIIGWFDYNTLIVLFLISTFLLIISWFFPYIFKGIKLRIYYGALVHIYGEVRRGKSKRLKSITNRFYVSHNEKVGRDNILLEDNLNMIVESMKFNKEHYSENLPLYIKREHLMEKEFWKKWAFAIVVLRGGVSIVNGDTLKINLIGQSYGIYNNRGKDFLREHFPKRNKNGYDMIDESFKEWMRDRTKFDHLNHVLDNYLEDAPLRWASSGILPIVKFGERKYVMLVVRSIFPIGLNLLLGASENKTEYKDLKELMLREFFEELLIVSKSDLEINVLEALEGGEEVQDRIVHYKEYELQGCLKYLPKNFNQKFKNHMEGHIELRRKDGMQLRKLSQPITLRGAKTPFKVKIEYDLPNNNHDTSSPVQDIIFTINPFEQGIDIVGVYEFKLEENDYPLYGEIYEEGNCKFLLRHPLILVSIDKIKKIVKNNEWEHVQQSSCKDCKVISSLEGDDYMVFTYDALNLRKYRIGRIFEKLNQFLRAEAIKELNELREIWITLTLQDSSKSPTLNDIEKKKKQIEEKVENIKKSILKMKLKKTDKNRALCLLEELKHNLISWIMYCPYLLYIEQYTKRHQSSPRLTKENFRTLLTLCPATWKTLEIAVRSGVFDEI